MYMGNDINKSNTVVDYEETANESKNENNNIQAERLRVSSGRPPTSHLTKWPSGVNLIKTCKKRRSQRAVQFSKHSTFC